jgi:hypothetical protein
VEWVVPDKPLEQSESAPDSFRLALLVSLAIHAALIALFFSFGSGEIAAPDNAARIVQIKFVPAELLRPELIPEPIELINDTPLDALTTAAEPDAAVPQSSESIPEISPPVEPPMLVEVPVIAESPTSPSNAEQSDRPRSITPDQMAIRQIVKSMSDREAKNNWQFNCTQSQKNNEFIKCADDASDIIDSQSLDSRRYFLTAQPDNTARRAQAFIGQNTATLRSRLNSVALDNITSGQLLEDIEASISVYSNTGNVPVQRLTDQIYANDPAYQQMKRVMGVQ